MHSNENSQRLPDLIITDIGEPVRELQHKLQLTDRDIGEMTTQVLDRLMDLGDAFGMEALSVPTAFSLDCSRLPDYNKILTPQQEEEIHNAYVDYARGIKNKLLEIGMVDFVKAESNFNYGFKLMSNNLDKLVLQHLKE